MSRIPARITWALDNRSGKLVKQTVPSIVLTKGAIDAWMSGVPAI